MIGPQLTGLMTSSQDRPNRIPWPPLIYGGLALSAVALHWIVPLPWPGGVFMIVLAAAGLCLACAAIALDVTAALAFRRHRTTILPHRGASSLVTDGPFAKSRNPIYLANTMLVSGAGLLFGMGWLVLAGLAGAFLTQKLAIEREERHLAARFGQAWEDYRARTPRWLFFR
jgi:protein-S-isoprenylcysteine O-methyltransferase Ste14